MKNTRLRRIGASVCATGVALTGASMLFAASAQAQTAEDDEKTTTKSPSCDIVAHAGDSLSVGMEQVGLPGLYDEVADGPNLYSATGGQAIIEKTKGVSGNDVVANQVDQVKAAADDAKACFVVAYGTNDANNVNASGADNIDERIDMILDTIGDAGEVFWVTPAVAEGANFSGKVDEFNEALAARAATGELTLIDWASEVAPENIGGDKIHLTGTGYKKMAAFVADSVAEGITTDSDSELKNDFTWKYVEALEKKQKTSGADGEDIDLLTENYTQLGDDDRAKVRSDVKAMGDAPAKTTSGTNGNGGTAAATGTKPSSQQRADLITDSAASMTPADRVKLTENLDDKESRMATGPAAANKDYSKPSNPYNSGAAASQPAAANKDYSKPSNPKAKAPSAADGAAAANKDYSVQHDPRK